jgi:hypothetical protein
MTTTVIAAGAMAALDSSQLRTRIVKHLYKNSGSPAVWEALLAPQVVDRTHQILGDLMNSLNDELTNKRAERAAFRQECFAQGEEGKQRWFDTEAEYEDWRRRAVGYKRAIEHRLGQTKLARSETHIAAATVVEQTRGAVRELALAIAEHRRTSLEEGFDAEEHDRRLWAVLEQVCVPYMDQMTPISDLIEMGAWNRSPKASVEDGAG